MKNLYIQKVKIVKILIYLDVNGEEYGGQNFKNWAIKNLKIKEPVEIEKEERSYYLKNYKELDSKNNNNVNLIYENIKIREKIEELENNINKEIENPEIFFKKLKEKYVEIVDVVIYTKIKKEIINGKIY